MKRFAIEIRVTPRPGILDPQGQAIHHALESLGYEEVEEVRFGKSIHLELLADDLAAAQASADEMCRKLLANPVTEDYLIEALSDEVETVVETVR